MLFLTSFFGFTLTIGAQDTGGANKLVRLEKIEVHGSRLPEGGVLQVSGLAVGQQVNDFIVNTACHKITSTGLVERVDYAYDLYPDRPTVALILTVVDEKPLLPAKIVPSADEEQIWKAIQTTNPLLTRNLPRTEKALKLYSAEMESALKKMGRDNQYVAADVTGDANAPSGIVFAIRSYHNSGRTH